MTDVTTLPTVNLEMKQADDQEVFYMEDGETGELYSIVFPPLLYEDAPAEVQEKYDEPAYRVRVQNHYNAAVKFVMQRMKCSMSLAARIVRELAGY